MEELEELSFCLDQAFQAVTEFWVVFSHFDVEDAQPVPLEDDPLVTAFDSCGWSGSASVIRTEFGNGGSIMFNGNAEDLLFLTTTAPAGDDDATYFELKRGTIDWTVSGSVEGCDFSGGSTTVLEEGKGLLKVWPDGDGIRYAMYGFTDATFQFTSDCGGNVSNLERGVGIWLCSGGGVFSPMTTVISNTFGFSGPGSGIPDCPVASAQAVPQGIESTSRTYSWDLSR
jgi:hypothetical protein